MRIADVVRAGAGRRASFPFGRKCPRGFGCCRGSVQFEGLVRHQAFHGATEMVRVECADGLTVLIRWTGTGGAKIGDAVRLNFLPGMPLRSMTRRQASQCFPRAYKAAVTIPPLAWITLFLLVPYF